jgi:hypothetical protein
MPDKKGAVAHITVKAESDRRRDGVISRRYAVCSSSNRTSGHGQHWKGVAGQIRLTAPNRPRTMADSNDTPERRGRDRTELRHQSGEGVTQNWSGWDRTASPEDRTPRTSRPVCRSVPAGTLKVAPTPTGVAKPVRSGRLRCADPAGDGAPPQ